MQLRPLTVSLAAGFCLFAVSTLHAEERVFQLEWSGVPFSNSAMITGSVRIDTSLIDSNSIYSPIGPGNPVIDVHLNVTGSVFPLFNGDFYSSDFAWGIISFNDYTAVDWDGDVLSQAAFGEFTFDGANGHGALSPSYAGYRELAVGSAGGPGIGEHVGQSAFLPTPEPGTIGLLGAVGVGLLGRRRR